MVFIHVIVHVPATATFIPWGMNIDNFLVWTVHVQYILNLLGANSFVYQNLPKDI